jgi:antitoxin Phd
MITVVTFGVMVMRGIEFHDAKARLSAVVDEAMRGKPAIITRHGKRQAVVVSYEDWERLSAVPSFGRFRTAGPLTAEDLPCRNKSPFRKSSR